MEPVRTHYERPEVVAAYRGRHGLDAAEATLVERFLDPGASVLELGVGAGRGSAALAERGLLVTGIDISSAMVDAARAACPAGTFLVADATDLPFPDGTFDAVVFLCNGIGHLERPAMARCFAEIARVTRGVAIVSFRSPYALNRMLPGLVRRALTHRGHRRDESVDHGTYVNRPSIRAMQRLARAAGLRPVETTAYRPAAAGRPAGRIDLLLGGQFFLVMRAGGR